MIWNPEIETASRDSIQRIQSAKLRETVQRAYQNVPHYKNALDAIGVSPQDINSFADITKLPFTVKDDLRQNYPFGMMAVPLKETVRLHASTGTTGKPVVVTYTREDLDDWSECIARIVCMAGGCDEDVAQISFGYGLFTGALGLHFGLEKVGATVIPISSGNTQRQIMMMRDCGTTLLISTPSYALYLAETMEQMGIRPEDLKLRVGLFGGEGHSEEMNKLIEERMGILATENYGLSEVMGPGVAGECYIRKGMHIAEDHFIVEIVDPDTLQPVPMGQRGEVVITTLSKRAMPMLRYRTRDISYIMEDVCECGRTSLRLAKIQGRSDDMLIVRGVNVFPSQIESVLVGMEEIGPHYEIIVRKEGVMDALDIRVELRDAELLHSFRALEELERKVKSKLLSVLGIGVNVQLVEPAALTRFEGKAKRVIDKRNE